jgi:predicted glutamine amidotransferase
LEKIRRIWKNAVQLEFKFEYIYTKEKDNMCKIVIIPGITDETTKDAWRLMKELSHEMTFQDDDGFGYAALDKEGKLFGERWFNPKDAFLHREKGVSKDVTLEEQYKGFIKISKKEPKGGYNDFGNVHEESLRSAILHARKATCARTMENLHPFVIGDTALVHNGVIANTEELDYKVSTCDSECILTEYIKHNVANDLKNIQKMADKLQGSYACGVISKMADGTQIIDVFRDSASKLRGYFIKELGVIVFGTSYQEGWGPIPSACKDLRFTIIKEYEIPDHRVCRINAMTGEVMGYMEFDGTYKGKRSRGGGGTTRLPMVYGGEDVHSKYNNVFGTRSHAHKSRHQQWSDDQKEKELERMLVNGEFNGLGYETYDPDKDDKTIPPIPNDKVVSISERKEIWEQDFAPDEGGTWHRRELKAVGNK